MPAARPTRITITHYLWTFGYNVTIINPAELTKTVDVPVINVRYPVEGTYTVALVVEDAQGKFSDPVSKEITFPQAGG